MKRLLLVGLSIGSLCLFPHSMLEARGRAAVGNRGAGARPAMPSRPSMPSRPATPMRPSAPNISSGPSLSRPAQRPSTPNIGSSNRPGTGNVQRPSTPDRPQIGTGNRPEIGQSTRPSIRPDTRPTTRPGVTTPGQVTRPGIDVGSRPSVRPGTDHPGLERPSQRPTLPGTVDRPGVIERPGTGTRPGTGLPGLTERPGLAERPGANTRPGVSTRPSSRPSVSDRRGELNNRLVNTGNINIGNINNIQINNNRWNNDRWYGNRYYGGWHHGCWHGNYWSPGNRWNYWWDNYPALTAFSVTTWAIHRTGWAFGYYNYSNPYAGATYVDNSVYNYSQPILTQPEEPPLNADPNETAPPPDVSPEALSDFDAARQKFFAGQYEDALASTNAALKVLPNDAVLHEFRALVLFALGKYQDSAATLYAVLSVGPGWDWTTMSGLYPSVGEYTKQLRALESYRDKNPNDSSARFVLAYHYLTAGHADEAAAQYRKILTIAPEDKLSARLLQQIDPDAEVPNAPQPVVPPKPESNIEQSALAGEWKATRDEGTFEMSLSETGEFVWKFAQAGQSQEVRGVWSIDDQGVLALQMNDEGVMLAQVLLKDGGMDFYMIGDTEGAEPLKFKKS